MSESVDHIRILLSKGADTVACVSDVFGKTYRTFYGRRFAVGEIGRHNCQFNRQSKALTDRQDGELYYRILADVHTNTVYALLRKHATCFTYKLAPGPWYEVLCD